MAVLLQVLLFVAGVLGILLAGTVVFDAVHFLLHRWACSRARLLRAVGGLHETHHRFLDRNLDIHPEYLRANLRRHVIPEYATHLVVSAGLLWVLPHPMVLATMGLQTIVVLLILRVRGMDINHRPIPRLRAYRPAYACLPEYHALHHAFPGAHFSSWIKLLDHVLGTGSWLRDRRVAIVGSATPFGAALADLLRREGVGQMVLVEEERNDGAGLGARLEGVEILVFAQQPTAQDHTSRVRAIEGFLALAATRKLPPEVWVVVGTGAGARAFTPYARRYYDDARVVYRHIGLPAAVAGAGALRAARVALAGVRRGYNYVPTRYTAASLGDFLRFRYLAPCAPAPVSDQKP